MEKMDSIIERQPVDADWINFNALPTYEDRVNYLVRQQISLGATYVQPELYLEIDVTPHTEGEKETLNYALCEQFHMLFPERTVEYLINQFKARQEFTEPCFYEDNVKAELARLKNELITTESIRQAYYEYKAGKPRAFYKREGLHEFIGYELSKYAAFLKTTKRLKDPFPITYSSDNSLQFKDDKIYFPFDCFVLMKDLSALREKLYAEDVCASTLQKFPALIFEREGFYEHPELAKWTANIITSWVGDARDFIHKGKAVLFDSFTALCEEAALACVSVNNLNNNSLITVKDERTQYPTFKSLFKILYREHVEEFIELLKKVEPAILNDEGGYVGGTNRKGVFVVFWNALKVKAVVYDKAPRLAVAVLFSQHFQNLDISDSLFSQKNTRATNCYKEEFEAEVAMIKASIIKKH
jgi:hypothetical protein